MPRAPRDPVEPGAGGAAGGPLENTGNNSSTRPLAAAERRADRWDRRALLWRVSSLQSVRHCGRVPRSSSSGIEARARDGVAAYAGLQHCGSVWSEPVCSAKILTHRALEIGEVLAQAVEQGHVLAFGTLTMRHRRSQPLRSLWDAASKAWGRSTSGVMWVRQKAAHGVVGWVRVWEVTVGRNGWHVHVHFVVVLEAGRTAADLEALAGGMFNRWARGLEAAGLEAPRRIGQEWHLATGDDVASQLGEYLFKLVEQSQAARSIGLELTHTQPGRSRRELATAPVWSLLEELVETGDADALRRWLEWEVGSKGRRQVAWSKGLRERFAPEVTDMSDDQVVEQEHGSSDDTVAVITIAGWEQLVRIPRGPLSVLEMLEDHGPEAMHLLLERLGIEHEMTGGR